MNSPFPATPLENATLRLNAGVVRIDDAVLLNGVDFALPPNSVTGLIGPNGAGKSTLVKALARQQVLSAGELLLQGQPHARFNERAFARQVAYLPQTVPVAPGLTVDEVVCLGRFPWHGALGAFTAKDRAAVDAALERTGTTGFAPRFIDSLSGGERQRCWIAMLVAQQARVLLLDEPVSALDARHQISIMALVRDIAREAGVSVLVVLHDVNLAVHHCDHITALKAGSVAWQGAAPALMDPQVLQEIYDTPMSVLGAPGSDRFAFVLPRAAAPTPK
jgi:iron complex transport system ATP-binding protein